MVTGAGSGIGRACALALAREGARVALIGRRKDRLEAVAREIGNDALVVAADVSKKPDIDRMVEQTVATLAASMSSSIMPESFTPELWSRSRSSSGMKLSM